MTSRKGRPGWFKESRRHALASKGIKTGTKQRPRTPPLPKRLEVSNRPEASRIYIGRANWDVQCDPDGKNATLKMDDHIGWRWDGDESSWDIFIIRMAKSRVLDEFISAMEEAGLDYSAIKKLIMDEDYDLDDAVYSLTGDNRFWHFRETGDADYEIVEEYARSELGLNDEQREKFHNDFWMKVHADPSFEAYKKKTAKFSDDGAYNSVKEAVRKAFREANDWRDITSELSSEDWTETEVQAQDMWMNSYLYPELERIGKLVKK